MDLVNDKVGEAVDKEWLILMLMAKDAGIPLEEVKGFVRNGVENN
ncbi:hypothetical protein [Aquibacillus kalidii]|nr:hypothetical protein [Aquibacillus kalidii]